MLPTVDVVVPCRNREALIRRAVRSAASQSHPPSRIIVVDDGSSDHTAAAASELGLSNLQVVRLEENGGASRARNIGIHASSSEWVAFLDSDDYYTRSHLEAALRVGGGNSRAVAVYTGYVYRRGDRHVVKQGLGPPVVTREHLAGSWYVGSTSQLVVRRTALDHVQFDEDLTGLQDYDFVLGLTAIGPLVRSPAATVVLDRTDDDRLSANVTARMEAIDAVSQKWSPALTDVRSFQAGLTRLRLRTEVDALRGEGLWASRSFGPKLRLTMQLLRQYGASQGGLYEIARLWTPQGLAATLKHRLLSRGR